MYCQSYRDFHTHFSYITVFAALSLRKKPALSIGRQQDRCRHLAISMRFTLHSLEANVE